MNASHQFAIIGCGKIAPRHAAEAAKQGRLAAVCDIIPDRADQLAKTFAARPYYSIDELLAAEKEVDVVAICTPNGLHAAHSISALKAGKHVLCEKPISISSGDARLMMECAKQYDRKLFVVKSTRYNPALVALKKLIAENTLGTLYSFQLNCFWNRPASYYHDSWKGTLDMDGGTLYTQFSHYIDALLWLLGDIDQVNGFRSNMAHKDTIEFEDTGIASIRMLSGMLGGINWSLNTYEKNMEVSLTLVAEKASIRIAGQYMNEIQQQVTSGIKLDIPNSGQANDYGTYKGSMSNHDHVYDNLVKALKDENYPFANASDGLKTVEAIELIYKSCQHY